MTSKKKILLALSGLVAVIAIVAALFHGGERGAQTVSTNANSSSQKWSALVQNKCLSCHAVENGKAARISDIRKTPEGWQDTISRMQRMWGVQLTREEEQKIVAELSDKNGLAPKETEKVMYWLADTGSTMEPPAGNEKLQQSCIRCHAIARPLAQYRTEEEWKKLKDFHIALNPSMIYQLRDLDWVNDADQALAYLAQINKWDSDEWKKWKESNTKYDITGNWRIVGYRPGIGMYSGSAEISRKGEDFYEKRTVRMPDGRTLVYEGNVKMYTGYSLRSSLEGSGQKLRGVFNVQEGGSTITGRWNLVGDKGIYGDETYYRQTGPALLTVWPKAVKKGEETTVRLIGSNLPDHIGKDLIKAENGLQIMEIVKQEGGDIWVKVKADGHAAGEQAAVEIAGAAGKASVKLFAEIDYIKVKPDPGVARIGDGDGTVRQSTQFEAFAYSKGSDGKENTEDDIEIGPVGAKWNLEEYKFMGIEDDDIRYVGSIDKDTGVFTPGTGGPNPKRMWSTNNTGNVTVAAVYKDPATGRELRGTALLIVSVPDYVSIK